MFKHKQEEEKKSDKLVTLVADDAAPKRRSKLTELICLFSSCWSVDDEYSKYSNRLNDDQWDHYGNGPFF